LAAALVAGAPASAHDHWLAPSTFHSPPDERLDLRIRVGHPAEFEERVRDPARTVRFEDVGPRSSKPILGVDGKAPAGILRPKDPGIHVLVYESNHAFVEIDPESYARFLAEEGLEDIAAERERRGERDLPGRDSYRRFDKALVCIAGADAGCGSAAGAAVVESSSSSDGAPAGSGADPSASGFDRRVGLSLELILETPPHAGPSAGALTLRLELEGRPLAHRQVKLARLDAPHTVQLARTDETGRARFTPEEPGAYGAFAVHQRRAVPEQGLQGDWEGLWASLTFELGG
jgi:hypothetical protein